MAECKENCEKISLHDKEILKQIFSNGLSYADDQDYEELTDEIDEDHEQVKKAKELEIQGVRSAEAGDIEAAINIFEQAIALAPKWPSAYNNRAQALRIKGDIEGAKADLDKALEFSHDRGMTACQAFTQRGLIRKREGNDDGAKQDFEKAASLGSEFAKQLLAAMNPYAALCNQMLCDVMQKLRSGHSGSEL